MRNYSNPLPGVPDVESPFFAELFDDGSAEPETLRIANDLHRDGFAVFDFPEPDFEVVSQRIRERLTDRYDWDDWREGRRLDLRIQDGWRDDDDIKRLAANANVLALLERLYGRAAFPFQTLNFAVGTQQHFHTDSVHFSANPERFMVGVWLAFEDIGPDQGPLLYYPGSHRWPIFTNEHIGHSYVEGKHLGNYYPVWERLVEVNKIEPKRFFARKGQAAIWAANLLHGGDAQHDKSLTRWSQVTHYYFENCAYYTPLMSDPFYGAVAYREPVNILTGEAAKNFYLGRPVPAGQIARTDPSGVDVPLAPLPEDFDSDVYLDLNPDVRAAGADAAEHYKAYGAREGRAYVRASAQG